MDYWQECIEEAFEDAGITATREQVATVVETVEGAHDNYSMAHGHECIPNPLLEENKQLSRELRKEIDKVLCPDCNGRGRITSQGPSFSTNSECCKCRGKGRYSP